MSRNKAAKRMSMSNNNEAIGELLKADSPVSWISFLFDLQTTLISYGYMGGMTKMGSEEFALKFQYLKNFFESLKILEVEK